MKNHGKTCRGVDKVFIKSGSAVCAELLSELTFLIDARMGMNLENCESYISLFLAKYQVSFWSIFLHSISAYLNI